LLGFHFLDGRLWRLILAWVGKALRSNPLSSSYEEAGLGMISEQSHQAQQPLQGRVIDLNMATSKSTKVN
jgi:hypothetical protein